MTDTPIAVNETVVSTTSGTSTKMQPTTNNHGGLPIHKDRSINVFINVTKI